MYKDLNNSIKKFSPDKQELDLILSKFSSHVFSHKGDNLFGEKYEVWVYEYLKSWALQCDDVTSFVVKDKSEELKGSNQLCYDKNGQIVYIEQGVKKAEYDGLFIYKNKIVFVESSVSELRKYFRNLEDRLKIKRDLLVDYFKTEEIYVLVVTRPKKRSLVYRSLPYLVLYKLKNPDFDNIQISDRVFETIDNRSKLVDLNSISSFFSSSF